MLRSIAPSTAVRESKRATQTPISKSAQNNYMIVPSVPKKWRKMNLMSIFQKITKRVCFKSFWKSKDKKQMKNRKTFPRFDKTETDTSWIAVSQLAGKNGSLTLHFNFNTHYSRQKMVWSTGIYPSGTRPYLSADLCLLGSNCFAPTLFGQEWDQFST